MAKDATKKNNTTGSTTKKSSNAKNAKANSKTSGKTKAEKTEKKKQQQVKSMFYTEYEKKLTALKKKKKSAKSDKEKKQIDKQIASLKKIYQNVKVSETTTDYASYYASGSNKITGVKGTTLASAMKDSNVASILKNPNALVGVEGIPYQFMASVDARGKDPDTGTVHSVGRMYGEKILARMPLVFMSPCRQVFMDDFNKNDKATVIKALAGKKDLATELLEGEGKYYTIEYDYNEYYKYLNSMMAAMAVYLNIESEEIRIGDQKPKKIIDIGWQNDTSKTFNNLFGFKKNLIFYADGLSTVSESFSNSTMESSLANSVNGYSDQAKELDFLLGGAAGATLDSAEKLTSTITEALSGVTAKLGGGIIGSLSSSGVNTIMNGGKVLFPKIWQDSSHSTSYNINFKFRSPDNDALSIYLNILKPYAKLLTLALPKADPNNVNGYRSPSLVKVSCQGQFCIDMGIITGLSVTKGGDGLWNDDGLPTAIDVSVDIEDLYTKVLYMSESQSFEVGKTLKFVKNTSYMDFLANTCGLNLFQVPITRSIRMWQWLTRNKMATIPSRIRTKFDQTVLDVMGKAFKLIGA